MEFEARTPAFYFYCNLSKVPPFYPAVRAVVPAGADEVSAT